MFTLPLPYGVRVLVATCGACAKKFARKVGNKKNITIFVKQSTKMRAITVLLLFIIAILLGTIAINIIAEQERKKEKREQIIELIEEYEKKLNK